MNLSPPAGAFSTWGAQYGHVVFKRRGAGGGFRLVALSDAIAELFASSSAAIGRSGRDHLVTLSVLPLRDLTQRPPHPRKACTANH